VFLVEAQSSNGKSTWKEFWMGDAARRIDESKSRTHILFSISAEDMVEEQMADAMRREAARRGDVESVTREDGLLTVAARLGSVPIYYIGMSIARAGKDVPIVNMTNVYKACFRIIDRRKDKNLDTTVMGIWLDYIQAMGLDAELMQVVADKRRHLQVREDFRKLRILCASLPAPGVCLAQSKAKLENAPHPDMQTPGLFDVQESSSIPQHTDRALSLWMPKTTHSANKVIEYGNIKFKVVQPLVWMRMLKQRCKDPVTLKGLPAGRAWSLALDFDTGEYIQIEPEDTFKMDVITRAQRRAESGQDPHSDY
jgi:hypothetical protein